MTMTPELEKRIAELKACEGKSFKRKSDGATIKVVKYNGIGNVRGVNMHTFTVEAPEGRWMPPATQFLLDCEQLPDAPETTTATPEVI